MHDDITGLVQLFNSSVDAENIRKSCMETVEHVISTVQTDNWSTGAAIVLRYECNV